MRLAGSLGLTCAKFRGVALTPVGDHIQFRLDWLRVAEPLQKRILNFYENLWNNHKSLGASTEEWATELSRPLQFELKFELHRKMLSKVPFLNNVDSHIIEEILYHMQSRICTKWDIIVRKGDPGEWVPCRLQAALVVLLAHVHPLGSHRWVS